MTHRMSAPMLLARAVLAVALALSWLLLAGTPASALIVRERVEKPKQGAVIKVAKPLIVAVERVGNESVTVHTRLFYGGTPPPPDPEENSTEAPDNEQTTELKPVSKKVLALPQIGEAETNGAGDVLRFGAEQGGIDPYGLHWLPKPGVARNGQYTLEFRAVVVDTEGQPDENAPRREWRRYEFRLDAPPPSTSAPGMAVADAAAKRISVAWQAHPVPDLSYYTVERQHDGGKWTVANAKVDPKQTQIDDTVPKYGSYRYRVTAVRPAGDGSDEMRATVSPPSGTLQVVPPGSPPPAGSSADDGSDTTAGDDDTTTSDGSSGTSAPPPLSSSGSTNTNPSLSSQDESAGAPDVAGPPEGFEDTYRGPLDYNVEQREVTERVPVEVAQGAGEDSTLTVLDRAIDQQRVLPPVAGGLILVVSAAHVLRYLHE